MSQHCLSPEPASLNVTGIVEYIPIVPCGPMLVCIPDGATFAQGLGGMRAAIGFGTGRRRFLGSRDRGWVWMCRSYFMHLLDRDTVPVAVMRLLRMPVTSI